MAPRSIRWAPWERPAGSLGASGGLHGSDRNGRGERSFRSRGPLRRVRPSTPLAPVKPASVRQGDLTDREAIGLIIFHAPLVSCNKSTIPTTHGP